MSSKQLEGLIEMIFGDEQPEALVKDKALGLIQLCLQMHGILMAMVI